ncbi:hypothetical protein [Fluviicola sp.]|jgi:hypothetical protein|uniref:hypothetical protein n=1 Tax=Fluviicola sp. TaxID=1917219 RepID=UPI00281FA695|nr:hypothetical protein [Fluviicola sp.]MDR0801661.1 hypothetical protein [Fluviicola sp.]
MANKLPRGKGSRAKLRDFLQLMLAKCWTLILNRPDTIKLIAQVRRAPAKDQLDVLKWLVQKFPNQANELTKE